MIRRFRHRGLRRLYEHDDRRELNPDHADKIARILARLDEAMRPEQLDLPGCRLRANWPIICSFQQCDVTDVDLLDYH